MVQNGGEIGVTITRTYSELIGEELKALEVLVSCNASEHTQALETLELPSDYDADNALGDFINNFCLDVVYWRGSNGQTRTEILRTCGGPRCDIIRESDDSDWVRVNTYSVGEPVDICSVYVPVLASLLDDLAEMAFG